jgi:hypothetical protein
MATQLALLNPPPPLPGHTPGQLTTAQQALAFMLAGNATFTIRSLATGTRFTYKVRKADPEPGRPQVWFVNLLNGPDNGNDFAYLGMLQEVPGSCVFKRTRGSRVTEQAPSYRAFVWLWERLWDRRLPANVEVWHEGTCGRCGRKLTVPESIAAGIGPECAGKL